MWPREVEEVLATHPAVAEVGVAGVIDESRGEVVKAWVVLRTGQAASEPDLRAYCKERLAPYKVPAKDRVPLGAPENDGRQGPAPGVTRWLGWLRRS